MKKKWLSELKQGELFTTTPNPNDLCQYYIALEKFESKVNGVCRICQPIFKHKTTWHVLKNIQVYSCGIIYKNV